MNLDVDYLIMFYKKRKIKTNKKEFTEQEASGGGSSPASSGKTPKKWESGRKFGKTYMNDPKYVWTSDITRGKANPLDY